MIKLNYSGNSRGTGSLKNGAGKFCMVIKPVIRAEKTAAAGLTEYMYTFKNNFTTIIGLSANVHRNLSKQNKTYSKTDLRLYI